MSALERGANLKPSWATAETKILPHINFGAEIDGPFEMQIDPLRRIYYERHYTYDHRDPRSRTPEDHVHDTLALEHWVKEPNKAEGHTQIFELRQTYWPDGSIKKQIRIDHIERTKDATYNIAWYDETGTLHRNGMYTGFGDRKSRARAVEGGSFEADELPEQIDFEATAQAFVEQINDLGMGKVGFQKPKLVPAA